MESALFYESFFFCPRSDLESLQLVRKSLLKMVVKGSKVLPLRSIDRVFMDSNAPDDKNHIFIEDEDEDPIEPDRADYVASILDGNFAETFHRLQNTCIRYFSVGIRDSPFLRYWKEQQTAAFTVVSINFDQLKMADFDVFDAIVNHLRPRTTAEVDVNESSWLENGYNSKYLKLLSRDSLRNSLQACRLIVWYDAFPLSSFILKEPGYPNYEIHCCHANLADGMDRFIETFVRDGCANKKLESVCIQWDAWDDDPSPMPKQLSTATTADVPLPKAVMLMWSVPAVHRLTQCKTQSFVNAKHWKQMEIFKWSVQCKPGYNRRTTHILQCRVEDL